MLAAVNFFVGLGSSSLFVDEVYSWSDASVPLGDLVDLVRFQEVQPPAYFAALHEWIGRFGVESEWGMRLPSAICALALVPAVFVLGQRVAGAGAVACFLVAISPLVLDYAQQVRTYAPVMLVCVLAGWVALRARSARGAALAGLLAALAFWMHYTAALVVLPFLAWIALRSPIPGRARALALGIPLLAGIALAPLFFDQLGSGRADAISPFARLTLENAVAVLGTPWDGRTNEPLDLLRWGAAIATTGSLAFVLARGRGEARLVALAGAMPLVAAWGATLLTDDDALITRYTAVGAPFVLVTTAVAMARLPRGGRLAALLAVTLIGVAGSLRGHDRDARFADARAAIREVAAKWQPGEPIVTPRDDVTVELPISYYTGRELPEAEVVAAGEPLGQAEVVWVVHRAAEDPAGALSRAGFRAERIGEWPGTVQLALTRGVR